MPTHSRRVFISALLILFVAAAQDCPAALKAYLSIQNIPGESLDNDHPNWIEVNAYGWSVTQTLSSIQPVVGRTDFQDFKITKSMDLASPKLYTTCASGVTISSATLSVVKTGATGNTEILRIRFSNVVLTSVKPAANLLVDAVPAEEVTFKYGTIVWTYYRQNQLGGTEPISTGWDVIENRPIVIMNGASTSASVLKLR